MAHGSIVTRGSQEADPAFPQEPGLCVRGSSSPGGRERTAALELMLAPGLPCSLPRDLPVKIHVWMCLLPPSSLS